MYAPCTVPISFMNSLHPPVRSSGISKLFLIIASNFLPLLGVIFWDWDLANVVLLYWTENLVIGFWTLAKMVTAQGDAEGLGSKLFICGFFTVHYGMFCMGHAAFILMILNASSSDFFPFASMSKNGLITAGVLTGTAIMFVTHGIDFVQNYLKSDQRRHSTAHGIMFTPYGHIVVIHLAIMATAFLSLLMGAPMILLLLIIIGKTLLEIITHKTKNLFKNKFRKAKTPS